MCFICQNAKEKNIKVVFGSDLTQIKSQSGLYEFWK